MRPIKLTLCLVLVGILVTACASPASTPASAGSGKANMNAVMASWKGRMAREAVAMWGMPDSIGREGTLGMLQWKADNKATGTGTGSASWTPPMFEPPEGSQAWPTRCNRVLMVDAAEVIQNARWYGSDCSTDPADYAPPP